MEESHFQGFASAPVREGVAIVLDTCRIDSSASSSLLNCAQNGRGPNCLFNCDIDPIALGQALTTSNQIKLLKIGKLELNDSSFSTIIQAVALNKSLYWFDACGMYFDDDRLSEFCESIHAHPTVKHLGLDLNRLPHGVSNPQMPLEQVERRMKNVLSMLHVNSVLGKVTLADDDSGAPPLPQNRLDEIETRLEMNMSAFEEQCHSLGHDVARDLRPKLLGRVLYMAQLHPALQWKFLSEHLDAVVEAADERIFANLDAAAQQQRRQVDRRDEMRGLNRAAP